MVGCAHVVLAQVLTQPKTAIQSPSGGDGANQTRGWGTGLRQSVQCVSRVSAVPSGQAMAELVLQLTLEDFGPPSSQVGGAVQSGGRGCAVRWVGLCIRWAGLCSQVGGAVQSGEWHGADKWAVSVLYY